MTIENEIFKRRKLNKNKLLAYGFVKDNNTYKYSKEFLDCFKAEIIINENTNVTGKVFDLNTDDEYVSFRIENSFGEFVNKVRNAYQDILNDIAINCFDKLDFISDQSNRISSMILEKYNDSPDFIFEKFPNYGVFKNPNNDKWYAMVLNVNKNKLDKSENKEVEILNIKLDTNLIKKLLLKDGFYPAYHMNKTNWITIILDDTLPDDEIFKYICESHMYTEIANEWIIPANPKFFDVIEYFNESDIQTWKQHSGIKVNDIVYLYMGNPYSAIMYKLKVLETNIPYEYNNDNLSMKKVMKVQVIEKYDQNSYTFEFLKENGVKAVRGPRSMPKELSAKINNIK